MPDSQVGRMAEVHSLDAVYLSTNGFFAEAFEQQRRHSSGASKSGAIQSVRSLAVPG